MLRNAAMEQPCIVSREELLATSILDAGEKNTTAGSMSATTTTLWIAHL